VLETQDAEESSLSAADSTSVSDLADSANTDAARGDVEAEPAQVGEPSKKSVKKKSQAEKEEEEALDAEVATAAQAMIAAALKERSKQEEGVSLLHEVCLATSAVNCCWFALVFQCCSGPQSLARSRAFTRSAPLLEAPLLSPTVQCQHKTQFKPTNSCALGVARRR
jgi:hypothetical protein